METTSQICLLWLMIIVTAAKHIPSNESSEESQRMQYSPLSSILGSTLDMEVFFDNGTASYFDSMERGSNWQQEFNNENTTSNNESDNEDDNPSSETNSIQKMINMLDRNERSNGTKSMKRIFLSNKEIVCNDGTPAGFYLRKSSSDSLVWVVFLEGGWYCYDNQSCRNRWLKLRHLMTSSQWPDTRELNGILSSNPDENPYWHMANHVVIPYCSSDTWSGTTNSSTTPKNSFHFMGKLIVLQVIRDLISLGLGNGTQLIFAGSSAGGTGVMINLDPVQHLLHMQLGLKHITVRGISDSGWFLDRTPYSPSILPPVDAIKKGYALWQGSLPKKCVDIYQSEPWRCYFGYRIYPTLRASLFVFQWLFDEAQMTADNVGTPVTPQQWDYIHQMGNALRASFQDVTAVFAPSCVSHSVLTKREWLQVSIDDVSVAHALRCWELATTKKSYRNNSPISNLNSNKVARKLVRSGESIHPKLIESNSTTNLNLNESTGVKKLEIPKSHRIDNTRRRRKKIERNNMGNSTITKRQRKKNRNKSVKSDRESWNNSNGNSINKSNNRLQQQSRNQRRKHGVNAESHKRTKIPDNDKHKKKTNFQNCINQNRTSKRNQRLQPKRKTHLNCHDTYGHNPRRHIHNKNKISDRDFSELVFKSNGTFGIMANAVIEESRGVEDVEVINQPSEKQMRPQRSLIRGYKLTNTGCEHRHIERCSWPQCNHSCPRLLDPYTGEEVHFIDMLKSFGLEMENVAQALGVDMQTLNNMEHAELLNLLTQQTN